MPASSYCEPDSGKPAKWHWSIERAANTFAVEFLMPHAIIKNCEVPQDLARLCKVSVEAAEYRMRDCGMWPRAGSEEKKRVVDGFQKLLEDLKVRKK